MGCVFSDRTHVPLTCAATGLIRGWVSPLAGAWKQLCSPDCLRGSDSAPEIRESCRGIAGVAPLIPPFPPRMSFSWFVRALMFISLGMSSPAPSHRFHTFLLANLTVLLPAAESEPGVRDPWRPCYCYCWCGCSLA